MSNIEPSDPLAIAVFQAIRQGKVDELKRLLGEHPDLANARIGGRTPLLIVADWPGHFPNGAASVKILIAAGADPNARPPGKLDEVPLHWAASCDDVAVLDALLDGGADIEAMGASIAGGTPLDDAVGYGQWNVARRLVERGAKVGKLWHASALGMMSVVEQYFAGTGKPAPVEISGAFWQACHGGQLHAAQYLLAQGADINFVPNWARETPIDMAKRSGNEELMRWLLSKGGKSSKAAATP